jgi:hypothetical protein
MYVDNIYLSIYYIIKTTNNQRFRLTKDNRSKITTRINSPRTTVQTKATKKNFSTPLLSQQQTLSL